MEKRNMALVFYEWIEIIIKLLLLLGIIINLICFY